jgi:hypothetical protein
MPRASKTAYSVEVGPSSSFKKSSTAYPLLAFPNAKFPQDQNGTHRSLR